MAMPSLLQQTAISNEKEALLLLKNQSDSLKRISDSLFVNQKQQGSLKREFSDLKKDIINANTQSFSEIKKYFDETKNTSLTEKRIDLKQKDNANIFSSAITRLLNRKDTFQEKSILPLQSSLLEETKKIKNLTNNNTKFLESIRKNYENPQKEKDQRQLAKFIGEELENTGIFDSGNSSNMLSNLSIGLFDSITSLGKSLLSGIGTSLAAILGAIGVKGSLSKVFPPMAQTKSNTSSIPSKDIQTFPETKEKDISQRTTGRDIPSGYTKTEGGILIPEEKKPKVAKPNLPTNEVKKGLGRILVGGAGRVLGGVLGAFTANPVLAVGASVGLGLAADALYDSLTANNKEENTNLENIDEQIREIQARIDSAMTADMPVSTISSPEELPNNNLSQNQNILALEEQKKKLEKQKENLKNEQKNKIMEMLGIPSAEETKEFLNSIGQFTNAEGKSVNVLPGLGDYLAKDLQSIEDAIFDTKSSDAGTTQTIVNNVTNMSSGSNTPINFPIPVTRDTDTSVSQFLSLRPIN